jgi:hypothetical protein
MLQYNNILQRLNEFNADPVSLLVEANEVYKATMQDGYINQKVAGRDMIELLERVPAVAVQAINLKLQVVKWLVEQADKEVVATDDGYTLTIVCKEPKDAGG